MRSFVQSRGLQQIAITAGLMAAITALTTAAFAAEGDVAFERIPLTATFHAEGSGIGDFNRDGQGDAVYGPYWYEGPEFTKRHEIYPPEDFDPNGYSNNFITFVHDVDGDGWTDVLANVWPGKEVAWFRNPGEQGGRWERQLAFPVVDNESPQFADVNGDGKPELVFHTGGVLGFAAPSDASGTERWLFTPCSEMHGWGQYTHGLGLGDVNGDGRVDLLMSEGWWEQPASAAGSPWTKHPFAFGSGGAQMHVYDVDGDGDGDVITSLKAHDYGLSWFEQVVGDDGEIDFVEHAILPPVAEETLAGAQFSQPHAVELADVNGDGLMDIITGKRFWAHGPKGDADPEGAAVLYWFELVHTASDDGVRASYTPHRIDNDSGVGTQFSVGDLNGDGKVDIVIGNKKGGFVFRQKP
ncbi:MAG: VCBS repeat-containing protein [Pirellulales bacterium]|nr:VCBS repeat-containing protein [Pirellulales bacterium]MBL7194384.1 VCBS repeat-containing protein [Pirellulales bacterium]